MQTRDELSIVADQTGAPVGAELIADISANALWQFTKMREFSGVYHLAPAGETSWYAYAMLIAEQARKCGIKLKIKNINPISTRDYPTPAKRPLNSRLNTARLREDFGFSLPVWQDGVVRTIRELANCSI